MDIHPGLQRPLRIACVTETYPPEVNGVAMTVARLVQALRERRHAATNGVLHVCLALDRKGRIVSGPDVRSLGMPGDDENPLNDALDTLADAAEDAIKGLDADAREDDDAVETAVARAVKKASYRIWERRPIVEATVLRV